MWGWIQRGSFPLWSLSIVEWLFSKRFLATIFYLPASLSWVNFHQDFLVCTYCCFLVVFLFCYKLGVCDIIFKIQSQKLCHSFIPIQCGYFLPFREFWKLFHTWYLCLLAILCSSNEEVIPLIHVSSNRSYTLYYLEMLSDSFWQEMKG